MKIVIATDVRYWRRETGAQQRIFELVKYFSKGSNSVTTIFVAPIDAKDKSDDRAQIATAELKVVSLIDDWRPLGAIQKLRWQWSCIVNALKQTLFFLTTAETADGESPNAKRLDDFESAELKRRFQDLINESQPDVVIVEYVTLAYLVPQPSKRGTVKYAIDTHDLLSLRAAQFREHGLHHWVDLTRAEEGFALQSFDLVIAIEPTEAIVFRELTGPDKSIVVAGHAGRWQGSELIRPVDRPYVSIGILASANGANLHAVSWFLENVWPKVMVENKQVELAIAGSICNALSNPPYAEIFQSTGKVKSLGPVGNLADFYCAVDVVVNPIQFGTGLKIKNIEAICFGRPLVTSAVGAIGIESLSQSPQPFLVATTADEMASQLLQLIVNPAMRRQMMESAAQFVATELTAEKVYGPLYQALKNI